MISNGATKKYLTSYVLTSKSHKKSVNALVSGLSVRKIYNRTASVRAFPEAPRLTSFRKYSSRSENLKSCLSSGKNQRATKLVMLAGSLQPICSCGCQWCCCCCCCRCCRRCCCCWCRCYRCGRCCCCHCCCCRWCCQCCRWCCWCCCRCCGLCCLSYIWN